MQTNLSIKRSQENIKFREQRLFFVRRGAIMAVVLIDTIGICPDTLPPPTPSKVAGSSLLSFSWRPSTFTKALPPIMGYVFTNHGLCILRTSEGLAEAKLKKIQVRWNRLYFTSNRCGKIVQSTVASENRIFLNHGVNLTHVVSRIPRNQS